MPKPFKIAGPLTYEAVKQRAKKEKEDWKKRRLQVVQMGLSGQYSREEVAAITGHGVRTVGRLAALFREGGLAAVLRRGYGGGPPRALQAEDLDALRAKLVAGEFKRAKEVRQWLHKERRIKLSLSGTYFWLGKSGGVLKVPRKTHAKQDAAASAAFRAEAAERLEALAVPAARPVRVWVLDEHRYGLIGVVRRCWTLRGCRPCAPWQAKYPWGYAYGALEVSRGASEFLYLPTVDKPCSRLFLEQIAASEPEAEHIVIQDQAGFHLRPGEAGVPARVHLLALPPYSPELNPVEQLWDMVKDAVGNTVFATLEALETAISAELRVFWESTARVLQLLGQGYLPLSVNATCRNVKAIS